MARFYMLVVVVVLIVTGILVAVTRLASSRRDSSPPIHCLCLYDNSDSPRAGMSNQPETLPAMMGLASVWLKMEKPDTLFEIWGFSSPEAPLEIQRFISMTMSAPTAPVYSWRRKQADAMERSLTERFGARRFRPTVRHSPIIEGIWRLMKRGEEIPGELTVSVISDLLQTSQSFTFCRWYLNRYRDSEILSMVAVRFPAPRKAPRELRLLYYPGLADGVPVTGSYETRLQNLFVRIAREVWAVPNVTIETLR